MANANWDDFCKGVGQFAKKAGQKIEELTDTAAIKLKITAKRADLDEEYGKLGKLTFENTYADVAAVSDNDREIAACVKRITALHKEIAVLEAQISSKAEAEFEGDATVEDTCETEE